MALFSQRNSYKKISEELQRDRVDPPLRNGLWTACTSVYWDSWEPEKYGFQEPDALGIESLATSMWLHYFKQPIDTLPEVKRYHAERRECFVEKLREYFFKCAWYEVYDVIEFMAANDTNARYEEFAEQCNRYLQTEMSAYRLVNKKVTAITSDPEIDAIEKASSSPFVAANHHLATALHLMADRKAPDYRNSIKESISAVESVCGEICHRRSATLGEALKCLDAAMHPALSKAFSSLYGYTSDAQGIRHALMDEPNLIFADAKFMLVACSGFVNYLIEKTGKSK